MADATAHFHAQILALLRADPALALQAVERVRTGVTRTWAKQERARLERLYGDAFRRYAAAVPSLVPRIYPYRCLAEDRPTQASWRRERFVDNDEFGIAAVVAAGVLAMVARWAIG